ncbi:TetR/AcrR family transcriptional regulator [Empedobacter tilapiae]|uniref:TetR/AcrR family transcriptional regulator n=1 Tax=Empedobacter tilapiae TaxID=2491114 RepID=A0A4Z1AX10_9FLAO|nr:TetR/AcrR family transcriptional regulator [Empedobacter tilapiae]TGN21636.1 TetR/AcrR family transcriptional regulator [Empedobacter tilapiae]
MNQNNDKNLKVRKTTSGLIRDKSRTMARMVAAVGKVLQKKGYTGLDAPSVAKAAGVDKKLVWTYFGGLDNLVEEYIEQRDFWKSISKEEIKKITETPEFINQNDINNILQGQLETLLKDKVLQKIIHWELGESNKTLRKIADKREEMGEVLFSIIDKQFENSNVDIRANLAILIGGIYYLTLHGKNNGSLFCGIDINDEKGKERISLAIENIINSSYCK